MPFGVISPISTELAPQFLNRKMFPSATALAGKPPAPPKTVKEWPSAVTRVAALTPPLPSATAVRVAAAEADSPAALAGIKEADLVIRLGDSPIAGIDDLQRYLTMSQVGIRTPVSLIRGTEQLTLEIVAIEAPHKSHD